MFKFHILSLLFCFFNTRQINLDANRHSQFAMFQRMRSRRFGGEVGCFRASVRAAFPAQPLPDSIGAHFKGIFRYHECLAAEGQKTGAQANNDAILISGREIVTHRSSINSGPVKRRTE
jgi:hypothetical protein